MKSQLYDLNMMLNEIREDADLAPRSKCLSQEEIKAAIRKRLETKQEGLKNAPK